MKQIGIIGCGGFIGSRFVAHCREHAIPLVCFEGDALNADDAMRFFSDNDIDQLVHLAGAFESPFYNQVQKNVLTVQGMLDAGVTHGLRKIVYVSSGAVYGEPVGETSKESDIPRPNTLYGLSKLLAETCIEYYVANYEMTSVILRFPNVYGTGMRKGVLYHFLNDIRTKGIITIAGDGSQSRNFLHVSDACRALVMAIGHEKSDTFNISNPQNMSVNDIVGILKRKHTFTITHTEKDNNLKHMLLDISKASRILGFYPEKTELQL